MTAKKILLALLLLASSSTCYPQLHLGLRAGLTLADADAFHAGLTAELIAPILNLGLDASLLYAFHGGGSLQLPLHAKWKLGLPPLKLYLLSGPAFFFPFSLLPQQRPVALAWDAGAGIELFRHFQAGLNYAMPLSSRLSPTLSLSLAYFL
ncbi:MAG: hypothetical protein LBU08_04330 [Tannerellaceae bacterium]|jgi:hypothetical protein|nr:hypothetical protein [Tannerellaceae bacterium]